MTLLLIGLGNILMMDEGFGVRVLERIEERWSLPPEIDPVDGGTAGMDMLNQLVGRDRMIVLDALQTGAEPGTVVRLDDEEVPAFFTQRISPHQLSFSDLLATLLLMGDYPKHLTVFGAVPEALGTGMMLSDTLAAQVDPVAEMVVAELTALGLPPTPKPG